MGKPHRQRSATPDRPQRHLNSGITDIGDTGTEVSNIRWPVDGYDVNPPAYGSHAGIPAHTTVLNGNSEFDRTPPAQAHTITLIADVDTFIAESNESNNSRTGKVTAALHAFSPVGPPSSRS